MGSPPEATHSRTAPEAAPGSSWKDALLAPDRGWFRSLRHPGYAWFWAGNFVSNIGTWMQNVALGWLVLTLTNSPFWLGAVGFAQQIPILFLGLFGGAIVDRSSRRKLLLVTQAVYTLLAFALAALTAAHIVTVRQILIIATATGITISLNSPSFQAAIRDLVPRDDTHNAIALNSMQFNTSRVAGPSLAGFAIAAWGVSACFYLNAVSFLPLIFILWRLSFPAPRAAPAGPLAGEVKEGLRYVAKNPTILLLILVVAMASLFGLPYVVMLPAFARDVLHLGPKGLGYLFASAGTGSILGGLRLASFPSHRKRGPQMLGASIVFFSAIVLFCFSRHPWLSALLLALVGAAMTNTISTANSLIQTLVPDSYRGRAMSMHSIAYLGFTPIGALAVGALAVYWGTPAALALSSGIALLLTILLVFCAPELRRLQ